MSVSKIVSKMAFSTAIILGGAFVAMGQALTYNATTDVYGGSNFRVEKIPVSTTDDLFRGVPGTHKPVIDGILASINGAGPNSHLKMITYPSGKIEIMDMYQLKGVIESYTPASPGTAESYSPNKATWDSYNSQAGSPYYIRTGNMITYYPRGINYPYAGIATHYPATPAIPEQKSTNFDYWYKYFLGIAITGQQTPAVIRPLLKYIVNVYDGATTQPSASAYILRSTKDSDPMNNLVILADGHDPYNRRSVLDVMGSPAYNTILTTASTGALANGYDFCFVDFADGDGDIRQNAKRFLKIVEALHASATGHMTVGGFSMGGIVSRLALLYAQKTVSGTQTIPLPKVKKYLSVDSPHQGAAGINYSFQSFIKSLRDYQSTCDASTSQLDEAITVIKNPAARQMFYENLWCKENGKPIYQDHDNFYKFLNDMGNWPKNMKLVSVSGSNWTTAGTYAISVSMSADPKMLAALKYPDWSGSFSMSGHYVSAGSGFGDYNPAMADIVDGLDAAKSSASGFNIIANAVAIGSGVTRKPFVWAKFKYASNYNPSYTPTFMPIYSVFDVSTGSAMAPVNTQAQLDELVTQKKTPFSKLYMPTKRYTHVEFNNELNTTFVNGLKF